MSERSRFTPHEKDIQVNLSILAAPVLVWLALAAIIVLSPASTAEPEAAAPPADFVVPLGA